MSGKIKLSTRAARSLVTDDEALIADARPRDLDRLVTVSGEVLDAIRDVFAGAGLAEDQEAIAAVLEARREVDTAWGRAARAFIEVGRTLNRLDGRLPAATAQKALRDGCERIFPFGETVASQLRAVARAVDQGILPEQECPASYSAAYQLTLLDKEELQEAHRRGLVSPGATRAALVAFRREQALRPNQPFRIDMIALAAERRRIDTRLERLWKEIHGLKSRRAEIEGILSGERVSATHSDEAT
jgi:hypothetical protein